MQGCLLTGFEELKWEVLEVRTKQIGKEVLVLYALTQPFGWIDPPPSNESPWREDGESPKDS